MTDAIRCGICGKELQRAPLGGYGHTTNPGAAHHYPRPATQRAGDHDLAGAGAPRSRDAGRRPSGSPVGVVTGAERG